MMTQGIFIDGQVHLGPEMHCAPVRSPTSMVGREATVMGMLGL
jgi:hypothetical protein